MNSQDSYDLDNLLADCANGELPDFRQTLNFGIEATSAQHNANLMLDHTHETPVHRSMLLQRAENENDRVMVNPTSGGLQVLHDLPEEFGLMNADGSIREFHNSERPDRDVYHENDKAEGVHTTIADHEDLAANTQTKKETCVSSGDRQGNNTAFQMKGAHVAHVCAPTETVQPPNMHSDATLNQHHVRAGHALLTQVQPQLDDINTVSQLINQASPLGRLAVGLQSILLANARHHTYIEAEARAIQMAQNAAARIHAMAHNTENNSSTSDQEAENTYAALHGTPGTAIQQPAHIAALQEQPDVVKRNRSRTSSKEEASGKLPPTQMLMTPQRTQAAHMIPPVHDVQALAAQNLASAGPNSNIVSHARRLLAQDISLVSSGQLQSNRLAVLKQTRAPVPTGHAERPHQTHEQPQEGTGSKNVFNAQAMSLSLPHIPNTGTMKQPRQSDTLKTPNRIVSSKKRKRKDDQEVHHFQLDENTQPADLPRATGPSLKVTQQITHSAAATALARSAVNGRMDAPPASFTLPSALQRSDEMNSLTADTVEEIMEMNGLRGQNHAGPHVSATPNGHHVVVNKYGVKLRFSKNGQASKYCHVCGRSALTAPVTECANLLIGLCQKVICEKCSLIHDPQYARRGGVGCKRSLCIHCRAICPEDKARCFQYSRNNEKRRTRNLERKRQKREKQEQEKQKEQGNKGLQDNDDRDGGSVISPIGVSDPNVF